jgi:hypothetical protein
MSGLPDPSDKVEPGKEEGSRTRIMHETGCNRILVRFLLAKSPTTGPNVLKIPFSEATPGWTERFDGDDDSRLAVRQAYFSKLQIIEPFV